MDFDGVKHAEQVLPRRLLSRTEMRGSTRRRRLPAATGSGQIRPLPMNVDGSSFSREPESFVAVEDVTGTVVILFTGG
jgi:hypothetical protein